MVGVAGGRGTLTRVVDCCDTAMSSKREVAASSLIPSSSKCYMYAAEIIIHLFMRVVRLPNCPVAAMSV